MYGNYEVPTKPGLGVHFDEDKVDRYRRGGYRHGRISARRKNTYIVPAMANNTMERVTIIPVSSRLITAKTPITTASMVRHMATILPGRVEDFSAGNSAKAFLVSMTRCHPLCSCFSNSSRHNKIKKGNTRPAVRSTMRE